MRGPAGCGCFPTGGPWPGLVQLGAFGTTGLCAGFDPDARWPDLPLAIVDVETTGLDPSQERVVEVAVVPVDGGVVGEGRGWLVNPGRAMPAESLAVHGLTDADLATAPPFGSVVGEIAAAFVGRVPVAYNADFDRLFLAAEFDRVGFARPAALRRGVEWIDPLVWARVAQRAERGHKLVDVAERMGIETGTSHRALADAVTAAKVFLACGEFLPGTYIQLVRSQKDHLAAFEKEKEATRVVRLR